jgi:hypothetical protein
MRKKAKETIKNSRGGKTIMAEEARVVSRERDQGE